MMETLVMNDPQKRGSERKKKMTERHARARNTTPRPATRGLSRRWLTLVRLTTTSFSSSLGRPATHRVTRVTTKPQA